MQEPQIWIHGSTTSGGHFCRFSVCLCGDVRARINVTHACKQLLEVFSPLLLIGWPTKVLLSGLYILPSRHFDASPYVLDNVS